MSFKAIMRGAFRRGLVGSEVSTWDQYRKLRGTTSHTYNARKAQMVFESCRISSGRSDSSGISFSRGTSPLTTPIDIRADHLRIVHDVLARHLPDSVRVWVFGSRATWATKDSSDLDLALEGETEIPRRSLSALETAFEESDLPYSVDIVDVRRIGERFRRLVETGRLPLPMVTREDTLGPPTGHDAEGDENSGRPSGWRDTTLRNLIEIGHGFAFGGRFIHDEPDGNILLTPGNFAIGGGFKGEKFKYYSGSAPSDFVLSKGDLIVTMTDLSKASDTLGYPAFVPAEVNGRCYLHNQRLGRIALRSQEIDARFLFYVMCSPGYRHEVLASATGTTVKHTSPDRILRFRLRLPPLAEQRAIAHILGALDNKIELNRRMNATLEAMARAVFRSWFIDFDPVRAKMEGIETALPKDVADLFPDRLVNSELGEIPEGWELKSLDAVARFQNGLALQKFRPSQNEARLPVIKIAQLRAGKANSGEWASAGIKPECVIEDGDVVFSWSGSLLVRTWCGGRAALNQHLFRVTSEKYPKWFYLHCLLSHFPEFQRIAADKATTMGHIKRHHLTDAVCVAPPDRVITGVSALLGGLLERGVATEVASRTLTTLRAALLPKLVSGEMPVRNAEKIVGAIA